MAEVVDAQFMALAASVAAPVNTFPNPRVGCVLVRDGEVVGVGAHHGVGTAHAEVNAIAAAGERARGATAYVTLEPCNHTGHTGPCSQALIAAGVARVVIGARDPNPIASGGIDTLRAAGIEVIEGVGTAAAEAVNEHWLHAMRTGRPFVTLKLATSLDGRVAAAAGVETAISGPESKREVHRLRSAVDAVLVGTATAVTDDPGLDVRLVRSERQPLRCVMGLRELPAHLQLLHGELPALLLRTHTPAAALAQLHARQIRHVLVEGGPTVARAFVEAGLVDECIWITAPRVLGAGPLAMGTQPFDSAVGWQRTDTRLVGDDLWSILRPLPLP